MRRPERHAWELPKEGEETSSSIKTPHPRLLATRCNGRRSGPFKAVQDLKRCVKESPGVSSMRARQAWAEKDRKEQSGGQWLGQEFAIWGISFTPRYSGYRFNGKFSSAAENQIWVSRNQGRSTRPSIRRSLRAQQAQRRRSQDVMEDIGIRRRRFVSAHLRVGVFAAAWGPRLSTLDTRACVTGRALQESCDATWSIGSMGTASVAALAVNSFHQRNQSAQRLLGGAVSDSKTKNA